MRPLSAAGLILLLAACEANTTRVVNTVPADAMRACIAATAEEAAVPEALVTVTAARPEANGPALTMNANGQGATCKLNADGEVTSVTMG